ncbi:MAG: serine O-acetyltransferase [bacterium]
MWATIRNEAEDIARREPVLASFLHTTVLHHASITNALSFLLANKLNSDATPALLIRDVMCEAFRSNGVEEAIVEDIRAYFNRDSACEKISTPFLYYKGFHALQAWRAAHYLWETGDKAMALFLQSRISMLFGLDIHPATSIGKGIMFDHGTGIVIGETAVVEDCVSIMQSVTLGGTGKASGDRHPKVRRGVMIGPGAKILGNIEIGAGSKIVAASVVLKAVEPHTIVAGVPAQPVGKIETESPSESMDQGLKGCCD